MKAEYRNSGRRRWTSVIFGVLCLLATPALLALAAFVAYETYNNSGLYKVFENAIIPLIMALVALLIGAAVLVNAWRNWRLGAALFENGLAFQSRTGVQQAA